MSVSTGTAQHHTHREDYVNGTAPPVYFPCNNPNVCMYTVAFLAHTHTHIHTHTHTHTCTLTHTHTHALTVNVHNLVSTILNNRWVVDLKLDSHSNFKV